MKPVTLMAIISISVIVLTNLLYVLANYRIIHWNFGIDKIIEDLRFLGFIGLLPFFIKLYSKQSQN